jgi:predicted nucleic acid-binding protein
VVVYESVLVDTDILIKAYRGDKVKIANLKKLKDKYCISVITACELLNGAKSIQQSAEMNKLLQIYMIALVDEKVSDLALRLFQKYSIRNKLKISDTFIAATALRNDLFIYTDNKSDFDFFVGIKFYLEKEF